MKPKAWSTKDVLSMDYEQCVSAFLKKSFNLNEQDENGLTMLHWCAIYAQTSKLLLLVDMGADTSIRCNNGNTILHYSCIAAKDNYLSEYIAKNLISPMEKNKEGQTGIELCKSRSTATFFANWAQLNKVNLKNLLQPSYDQVLWKDLV